MSSTLSRTLNEFKAALLCGVVIIIIAVVNAKGQINIVDGAIGMVMICVLAVLSMRIKAALPIQLPAFAWASLHWTTASNTPSSPSRAREKRAKGLTSRVWGGPAGYSGFSPGKRVSIICSAA